MRSAQRRPRPVRRASNTANQTLAVYAEHWQSRMRPSMAAGARGRRAHGNSAAAARAPNRIRSLVECSENNEVNGQLA